jgi:predicted aspartyl protease
MLHPSLSLTRLIILSALLAVFNVACSSESQNTAPLSHEQSVKTSSPVVLPTTLNQELDKSEKSKNVDYFSNNQKSIFFNPANQQLSDFEKGLDKAAGALSISQSAQSPDDWKLVAHQYQEATNLMKKVMPGSAFFPSAQTRIGQYQRQAKYAQQKIILRTPSTLRAAAENAVTVTPQNLQSNSQSALPSTSQAPFLSSSKAIARGNTSMATPVVTSTVPVSPKSTILESIDLQTYSDLGASSPFIIPIKRRIGGTPVIEVTFNGKQHFDMIVDTGASGTVITQQMANALALVPTGKAKANTASAKAIEFPIAYVDSMEVAGVSVKKIPVAIAGTGLDIGLLGHDFFGDHDVTIKRDTVEFRPQS